MALLGRPVKLIHYDDQTNPATVPSLYTKLIDLDKVDRWYSPMEPTWIARRDASVIQKASTMMGLFGVGVNKQFNYDRYFQIMPLGVESGMPIPNAFFEVRETIDPKPTTIESFEPMRNSARSHRTQPARLQKRWA